MADGERVGKYSTVEGREVYAYFVPLSGPGERVTGLLEVTRKRRDIDLLMTESRQQALVLLGIAVAVIAVVVILGHHAAVGRSLRAVEDTIRDADSGDMLQRAPVGGPREVVAVAEALNAMLDSLHHAEVCVARERGSRARLEEELRRSETLAAIGRLAAGIAHELGSPLTLADGHAQRVLRVRDLRGRVRDEVVRLRHEIGRMARIVRMLLDYGRGGGREMRSIDVHRLLTVCSTAVRASASEREVALDIDVPTTVSKMVGNESRIEQAVVNLLRNAVEAAHAQVHVEVRTRGGCLELTIDDDGSGVPPSVAQTLFEPFVTTKGSQGGTGLGLAIASSAAQEHGGALTVSTGPLGGARFVLSLRRDRRVAAHERGAS
jgi:signal transduction histidine kinase